MSEHPWDKKGLGPGPYTVTRFDYIVAGGDNCAVCGAFIKNRFQVRNAARRSFPVGPDCVARAEEDDLDRQAAAARKEWERRDFTNAKQAFENWLHENRERLAGLAHPKFEGKRAIDYGTWALENVRTIDKFEEVRATLEACTAPYMEPEYPLAEWPGLYHEGRRVRAKLVEVQDKFASRWSSVVMKTMWLLDGDDAEKFGKWLPFGNCEGRGRKLKAAGLVEKMEKAPTRTGKYGPYRVDEWGELAQ